MKTKNEVKTKRPHTGKLGVKQMEFIYQLREKHTMSIKSEFKKRYGYEITSGRIKSAIDSCEINNKIQKRPEQTSRFNATNTHILIMHQGKAYTFADLVKLIEENAKNEVINQIKSICG